MPLSGEYEPSTSDWARENAEKYIESGGTDGTELQGRPVILLTSIGAKTGKIRKTPLMRVEHEGRYALVASQGGAPTHPVWYHNVTADPHVELQGKPVILLTTVGAKTGKIRKTPLMRVEHGGEYAVVASLGGAPKNPVWYHNIKAHPRVELQDGTVNKDYEAREVFGDEKAAWWERAVAAWPDYANYQTKTDRQIPVFVLTPIN